MKLHLRLRYFSIAFAAWAVLGSSIFAHADASTPWPAVVPGFIAPAANEHPRMFFRKADLPTLRARARTAEGQAIIARLKVLLGGGEAMPGSFNDQTRAYEKKQDYPTGTYSISHAAGFGFLYQLTGEKKYAQLGRECFEKAWAGVRDCDDEARYSWVAPGGMLRAGPSLGWYALGYDLCHDGWDAEFCAKTAAEIQNYAQQERGKGAEGTGEPVSLERLARNPKHPPGSNHYGAQIGGAALALLAIKGDTGTDSAKTGAWLDAVEKNLIVEMTKGWGDHGWFAEGDGPAAVAADTALIPAFQAMRVAGGRDFIAPRTNVPWMTMKWVMLTQLSPGFRTGKEIFPLHSGTYDHNVWARTGLSGAGQFAQGFGAVTAEQRPALLWLYNRLFQNADAAANAPFDTVSAYPHRAVLSFINWPFAEKERNPGELLPRAVEDKSAAHYMFRNRWQDGDDIIVDALLKGSKGHYDVKAGGIIVWGLGEKTQFPVRVSGDVKRFEANPQGGVMSTSGGSFGVDFGRASGADAVLVLSGPIRGNIAAQRKGRVATTHLTTPSGNSFVVMTLTASGPHPEPKLDGESLVLGAQKISVTDGLLSFSK